MYLPVDDPSRDISTQSRDSNANVALNPGRTRDVSWLVEQWQFARQLALGWDQSDPANATPVPFLLVIDEIQKVPKWPDAIKGLWDRSICESVPMHLVLLGSSPLLMNKGTTDSLAGRFEMIRMGHWSFEEMNTAFGVSLEEYVYFGGFPGGAQFLNDGQRWRDYVTQGLIYPNIEIDILQMTRIDKPALLKQLFELGCSYSGQIVSLDKMLGQLHDAGNVTTLSRYLDLLGRAGLLTGLYKHSDHALRRRNSPPKFQALNNALMSAMGSHTFDEARADRSHWGRLVESAVGAHLCGASSGDMRVHYWRDGALEVDFVIEHRGCIAAIEVKSGKRTGAPRGLEEFSRRYPACRALVIGSDSLPLGEFLRYAPEHWLE
jgi:predicted AAA+ superfamily ATPase